jgi:hypothetical protein
MVIVGLLRASSAPLEWRRHDDVTLSTRRPSSKLSAAFLVKRVRDVKNEPGGKHAVTKRQNKAKKAENKNASAGLAKLRAERYEREFARCATNWSSCSFGS